MDEAAVTRGLQRAAVVVWVVGLVGLLWMFRYPIVHDATLMHYIGWRLWEGDKPWVDVIDVNLPATYLFHMLLHGAFGGSAVAWHVIDSLAALCGAYAIVRIVRPFGSAVAWLAGGMYVQFHVFGGAVGVGQRDFFAAVLMLMSAALVLDWLDRRRGGSWWVLGLLLGVLLAIKPSTLAFAGLLVAAALWVGRDAGARVLAAQVAKAAAGVGLVIGGTLAWVVHLGVFDEMVTFWTTYMPLYRRLTEYTPLQLVLRLRETPSALLLPLAPFHLVSAARNRPGHQLVLTAGIVGGIVHFLAQSKGYTYHLEPYAAFLIPAGTLGLQRAWQGLPWRTLGPVTAGAVTVILAVETFLGFYVDRIERYQLDSAASLAATVPEGDSVVVMDLAQGGIQFLWQTRTVQANPFLYDFYFYHDEDQPIVQDLRRQYLASLQADPPDRIVLFDKTWPVHSAARIDRDFPELGRWVKKSYQLDTEIDGYRMYVRRPDDGKRR
ncbi:MAG: hypothetical protein H6733_17385 [Alphaproteobacteria bacterium]|nr:hypothetical protein [Alphaproteobacteria bacterium]